VLAASLITAKAASAAPLEGNIQEVPDHTQLTSEKGQSHEAPKSVMD